MFKNLIFSTSKLVVLLCSTSVFLFNAQLAFALPKSVQAEYLLTRNGKPVAKVKESFSQNGKTYSIKSTSKGIGIYALMGERKLISTGSVTKDGLKPSHFESLQGRDDNKSLIADFDWAKSTLNMQVKGEPRTEKLPAGTQDLASYAYQFMFNPPKNDAIKVTLTTGKRLNIYNYGVVARGLKINAAKTSYKTVHISNQTDAADDQKQLWLAEDLFYLPVRYLLKDDDGDFEQTLTKIHVE
jgi:Protein of unknown function (DUF3108)